MTIFRDKRMKHNRPDITVVHKDKPLVDIAVLADQNILSKEEEKVEKYQDLLVALEIKGIHSVTSCLLYTSDAADE